MSTSQRDLVSPPPESTGHLADVTSLGSLLIQQAEPISRGLVWFTSWSATPRQGPLIYELRVREIHRAIFPDDTVASALVGRHHCNLAEFAGRVNPGHCELRVFRGPDIQHVSGWRVVKITHAVRRNTNRWQVRLEVHDDAR